MITHFQRSWQLFKASVTVTLKNRKLLWFPVLTTMLTGFIALFFISAIALPLVLHPTGYKLDQKEHWAALVNYYVPAAMLPRGAHVGSALGALVPGQPGFADKFGPLARDQALPWWYLGLLPVYFASMFLATFFNVAFYSEIMAALNGQGVSFRRGLGVARSRLSSILAWTCLAGVVGWLIRVIEEKMPFGGRLITGLLGMAWSIAAVFAIPVIIHEQPISNPIKILQQSATTLKRTWGEGLIGYVGFSAGSWVIFACSLVPLVLAGIIALVLHNGWLFLAAGILWALGLLAMHYISGVAGNVYRCALYLYAAEGVVPEPYNQELLDMAWKVKQG